MKVPSIACVAALAHVHCEDECPWRGSALPKLLLLVTQAGAACTHTHQPRRTCNARITLHHPQVERGPGGAVGEALEAKGLDMVRRDWCPLSKEAGNYALGLILSGETAAQRRRACWPPAGRIVLRCACSWQAGRRGQLARQGGEEREEQAARRRVVACSASSQQHALPAAAAPAPAPCLHACRPAQG